MQCFIKRNKKNSTFLLYLGYTNCKCKIDVTIMLICPFFTRVTYLYINLKFTLRE